MAQGKMWRMVAGGQEQFFPETLAAAVYMDEAGTKTLPEALEEIELTPGPPGEDGAVGPAGPPGADGHTPTLAEIGAAAASHTHTKANITDFSHTHATSDITNLIAAVRDALYPVGCIYMSVTSTNPGSLFGGTWAAWGSGRVPVGVDAAQSEFNTVEETGGAKTHTLSIPEIPSHTHEAQVYYSGGMTIAPNSLLNYTNDTKYALVVTLPAGGGGAHNNLQPYITCYMWKRTA